MKKHYIAGISLFLCFLAGFFYFCWIRRYPILEMPDAADQKDSLIIYSCERESLLDAAIPLFEEKYGISVYTVTAESKELLKIISQESNGVPQADLLLGGSLTDLNEQKSLFLPYVSFNDKYLLAPYRNTCGFATNYVLHGNCLAVNQTLAGRYGEIKSYSDLLRPEFYGEIALADPAVSSSGFEQLVNILDTHGGYQSDEAWELVKELLYQAPRGIYENTADVYQRIASGRSMIGLSREDSCAQLIQEGADLKLIYPEEGTLFTPRTVAILRNCSHAEYAKHFVDFLTGKDMQDILGTLLTSRPVRRDAQTSLFLPDIDSIPVIQADPDDFDAHREEILMHYERIRREAENYEPGN